MNKVTIATVNFQRKPYAQPQIKVAEINCASIICTSDDSEEQTEGYEDGDTSGWYNN